MSLLYMAKTELQHLRINIWAIKLIFFKLGNSDGGYFWWEEKSFDGKGFWGES